MRRRIGLQRLQQRRLIRKRSEKMSPAIFSLLASMGRLGQAISIICRA